MEKECGIKLKESQFKSRMRKQKKRDYKTGRKRRTEEDGGINLDFYLRDI